MDKEEEQRITTTKSRIVIQCRNRDPIRLLAYRWYNALRRRGIKTSTRDLQPAVRDIIRRWGLRSVISNTVQQDAQELCIFPYFGNAPPDAAWNGVIVTLHEARVLSHICSQERAHLHFPAQVRQVMNETLGGNLRGVFSPTSPTTF